MQTFSVPGIPNPPLSAHTRPSPQDGNGRSVSSLKPSQFSPGPATSSGLTTNSTQTFSVPGIPKPPLSAHTRPSPQDGNGCSVSSLKPSQFSPGPATSSGLTMNSTQTFSVPGIPKPPLSAHTRPSPQDGNGRSVSS